MLGGFRKWKIPIIMNGTFFNLFKSQINSSLKLTTFWSKKFPNQKKNANWKIRYDWPLRKGRKQTRILKFKAVHLKISKILLMLFENGPKISWVTKWHPMFRYALFRPFIPSKKAHLDGSLASTEAITSTKIQLEAIKFWWTDGSNFDRRSKVFVEAMKCRSNAYPCIYEFCAHNIYQIERTKNVPNWKHLMFIGAHFEIAIVLVLT